MSCPSEAQARITIPLPPLAGQRRIVSELDAEAAQMEAVRSLLPASRPQSNTPSTSTSELQLALGSSTTYQLLMAAHPNRLLPRERKLLIIWATIFIGILLLMPIGELWF